MRTFVDWLHSARERSAQLVHWSFVDGTPLQNDIPVMAAELVRDEVRALAAENAALREALSAKTEECERFIALEREASSERGLWRKSGRELYDALEKQNAKVRELSLALKPFCFLIPDEDGDKIDGLPDGHGFEIIWAFDGDDGCGPCDFTAGHVRRARAALSRDPDSEGGNG